MFQKNLYSKLLLALLHPICARFPVANDEIVSVSCPCYAIHQVSPAGFALLEQIEVMIGGIEAEPQQKLVEFKGLRVRHLEFASRALRQKQKVANLYIWVMTSYTGFELLQNCKLWKIETCWVVDSRFMLEGLADEAAQGSIDIMIISDKTIDQSKIT